MSREQHQLPPHDVAAEEAALGAALLSADALAVVLERLAQDDFYRPAHRTIYAAIRTLHSRGEPVDPVTVAGELNRSGAFADVGGASFLHDLVAGVPTAANTAYYTATVAACAKVRRVIDLGHQLVQVGFEEPGNADRAVELAREVLEELGRLGGAGPQLLTGLRDGAWLDAQDFPPLAYAVPGLIPEGSVLLVGPPKIGKSWLVLTVALAAATGGRVFGLEVPQRPTLYMGLEDGDRRLQDRCRKLLRGDPIPRGFEYLTRVEPGRIVDTITCWLDQQDSTPTLVILDTLGKVLPPALLGESSYQRDYRIGTTLKRLTDEHPGMTLLTNHQDRKANAEDFVDSVSGTHGLAGAADTVIVLTRSRNETNGLLQVTGRDIPEGEYALQFADGCNWNLDGADLAEAAARARETRVSAGLGDRSAEIIAFVAANPPHVRAGEVEEKFGPDARRYLKRLADTGRLRRLSRGIYTAVPSESVSHVSQVSHPQVSGGETLGAADARVSQAEGGGTGEDWDNGTPLPQTEMASDQGMGQRDTWDTGSDGTPDPDPGDPGR